MSKNTLRIDRRRGGEGQSMTGCGGSEGVTLLEMLVVLVIIGLLAGLIGPRLLGRVDQAKVTTAVAQIKSLKATLQMLRLDMGRYPTAAEGLNLLVSAPRDSGAAALWHGPYLDGEIPLDPWGRAYQYQPGGSDSSSLALFSLGADGQPGGTGLDADLGILPPKG